MLKKLMLVVALFGAGFSYAQPDLPYDTYEDRKVALYQVVNTLKTSDVDGLQKLVDDCYSHASNKNMVRCINLDVIAYVFENTSKNNKEVNVLSFKQLAERVDAKFLDSGYDNSNGESMSLVQRIVSDLVNIMENQQ